MKYLFYLGGANGVYTATSKPGTYGSSVDAGMWNCYTAGNHAFAGGSPITGVTSLPNDKKVCRTSPASVTFKPTEPLRQHCHPLQDHA